MRRVLTAAALIPPVLYVVLASPAPVFLAVLILVSLLSFHEYAGIAAAFGFGDLKYLGYAAGMIGLLLDVHTALVFTLCAMLAMVFAMRSENLAHALPRAALLIFGVAYVFGGWRAARLLRDISPHWLIFGLALNWAGDIAAYYAGRAFGKHRLARRVSPGKSWEGAVASAIGSAIFGVVYLWRFLPGVIPANAIGIALAGNVAGQFGDLCESAMKRGAGVKDSGTLLPGHGGFLDRVDSTLFSLPVVYLILQLAGL